MILSEMYVSQPSRFLAGFFVFEPERMSMFEMRTSELLEMRLCHYQESTGQRSDITPATIVILVCPWKFIDGTHVGRVAHIEARDGPSMKLIRREENGALQARVGSKAVIPRLPLPV